MSDTSAHQPAPAEAGAIAKLLEGVAPMGNLSELLIDDLASDEEDAFYRALEQA